MLCFELSIQYFTKNISSDALNTAYLAVWSRQGELVYHISPPDSITCQSLTAPSFSPSPLLLLYDWSSQHSSQFTS